MENGAAMSMELRIKGSFRTVMPPLTPEEYVLLEQSIVAGGCHNAILTWNGYIVDGHNRFEICQKHGIHFTTEEIDFETEQDALVWIINNQLGRRNVTECQKNELDRMKKDILLKKGDKQCDRWTDILSIVDKKLQPHSAQGNTVEKTRVFPGVLMRMGSTVKKTYEKIKVYFWRSTVAVRTTYSTLKKGSTILHNQEERDVSPELSALEYAEMAITYLEKIRTDDPIRDKALEKISEWMRKNELRCTKEVSENTQETTHEYQTGTKSGGKTSVAASRKSQGIIPKKNLRGMQESLWGKEDPR